MYALLTLFNTGPGMRPTVEKMSEQLPAIIRSMKGFKGSTFFGDDSSGEYGGVTLWEWKEDAEACLAATGPEMQKALSGLLKGPPKQRVYEVWDI